MARVRVNSARVELSRQHSLLVNERAALLNNLQKEYPYGVPARKYGKVSALTRKIQRLNQQIVAVHKIRGGLVSKY